MGKLWMIGLAASAAWTQAAIAQPAPPAPPPMAHGAHAPAPGSMAVHGGGHHVMPPAMPGGHMRPHPMPGHMPGMHRIGRGGFIPPFFMGPQFIVHDWRMFGFPAPMGGAHWIRYYDDALLVDRDGRVIDGRYGWDWDRRRDDDRYDDEDWDDDRPGAKRGRHHKRDKVRVYRHGGPAMGGCRRRCPPVHHVPPPPHPGYGYGYAYGCGCGGVVVTETTTTTTYPVETRTYYETVTEHRAAPRRHHAKPVRRYAKPVRRAPAPRPGERG